MGYAQSFIDTVKKAWPAILGSVGVAAVAAFVFINFLRFFTGIMTWLVILASMVGLLGSGTYLLLETKPQWFGDKLTHLVTHATASDKNIQSINNYIQNNQASFEYLAYFLLLLFVLLVVFVIFFCRSIRIAIGAIKSAAIFIDDDLSVFIVPLVHVAFVFVYLALWAVGLVYLCSLGEIDQAPDLPPYG